MLRHLLACLAILASPLLPRTTLAEENENAIRIACVGDSITFGAGVKNRKQNAYPVQLQNLLGDDYHVTNLGVSGATLLKQGDKPYWKLKQFKAAQELQPNIVVIKLGTNDTKPHNWKHKEDYQPNYIEMIETFRNLDSKPTVYLCYPVPVVGERWGINDKTVREEVIPFIDAIAEETDAPIIDLYAAFEDKLDLIPDKVHPNAEGATVIANTVAKVLTKDKEDAEDTNGSSDE